jgi:predicted alpha/beta hydrolase family esterase
MKQVILIHGGDTFGDYESYLNFLRTRNLDFEKHGMRRPDWQANITSGLGDGFQVIRPEMPSKWNAKYQEWKIWFERFFTFLNNDIILIGSSLGGSFLVKYLSENTLPNTIKALFLIAAASSDEVTGKWSLYDFLPPKNLTNVSSQTNNIILYHSKDDDMVPINQVERFEAAWPQAMIRIFEDRDHFNQAEIPELLEDIKRYSI